MENDIFNAVFRRLDQTLVQRDRTMFQLATAPSGSHVPQLQKWKLHLVGNKPLVYIQKNLIKDHQRFLLQPVIVQLLLSLKNVWMLHMDRHINAVALHKFFPVLLLFSPPSQLSLKQRMQCIERREFSFCGGRGQRLQQQEIFSTLF